LLQRSKIHKGKQAVKKQTKPKARKKGRNKKPPHTYPKSLSQEAATAAGYLMQKEKKLSIHQGLPSPAQQSCFHTKKVGMKILSVTIGTAQSCFHAKRVGMKILSLCNRDCSIASSSSLGFYEGDGVRAMGDASKTPNSQKHTRRKARDMTNAHVSVDQSAQAKGG
jgi:hypothetical protein